MALLLDDHDRALALEIEAAILHALSEAHHRTAVAKRIAVIAVRERNRGRAEAKRRYPFRGICEASGLPIDERLAVLDELDPELGYAGRLRWVCNRANNSGTHSCGGC